MWRERLGRLVLGLVAASGLFCSASTCAASGERLAYHGGPVLTHPSTTYFIYWRGMSGTLPASYIGDLAQFVNDWSGSNPHGVLGQYYQRVNGREYVSNAVGYGGLLTDDDPFPGGALSDGQIAREVRTFASAHQLPEGYAANYAVLLPGEERTQTHCAWHDWVSDAARAGKVFYSVIPYYVEGSSYSRRTGCHLPHGPFPHGEATDNGIDMLSHELSEVATNPWHTHADPGIPRSWYAHGEGEVGDLCRFVYGPRDPATGADVLLNGHPYLIQGEWSNAEGRCSLGPTPASLQTYISDLAQFSNPQYGATVKPRNIKFYSGAYLERLRWRSWGYPVARATGAVNIVDKSRVPYTAHYYPVTVQATGRRRCGSLLFYTRLHVHFKHRNPHELARNSTFVMNCSS